MKFKLAKITKKKELRRIYDHLGAIGEFYFLNKSEVCTVKCERSKLIKSIYTIKEIDYVPRVLRDLNIPDDAQLDF